MEDDYLGKSPAAGRMGKAAEYLVAALCILATGGDLNVSTSLVDDEGVDLIFHRRGQSTTLAVQVKARMSDGKQVQKGRFGALVRSQTFRARADLDMLFVAVDVECGAVITSWLVPSPAFAAAVGEPDSRGRLRFSASMSPQSKDRWSTYRHSARQLPAAVQRRLNELEAPGPSAVGAAQSGATDPAT